MSGSDAVSPFVGWSRLRLVDGLVRIYDGVLESGTSRWVSLEGPSGWGKTRVAHELFARLSARQEEPRYWPAVIDDPDLGRKAAQPGRFVRPKDSLPEFLWWGIACSARQGLATAALTRDIERLSAHGVYVEAAWRALVSARERFGGNLSKARRILAEETAFEVMSLGVEQIAGAVVPVLGVAARLTRWAGDEARHKIRQREDIASDTVFDDEPSLDVVDDTADLLGRFTKAGFPVLIFVEDAHAADEVLLELIGKMLRREGTVLVITTAWPDFAADNPALSELMREHEGRLSRVGHTEPAGPPFSAGAGLLELEADARSSILHNYYPNVEAETEDFLLQRYVNPLALELFGQVNIYRTSEKYRTSDGALWLPHEARDRLPRSIRALYRTLWAELPVQVQFALAVAHVLTPANISPDAAKSEDTWMVTLLQDVIGSLGHLDELDKNEILDALAQAPTAHAWVRIVDEYLRSFAEESQKEIVKTDGYEYLEDEFDDPREQILNKLTEILLTADGDVTNTINGARSVLALHAIGKITHPDIVAKAIEVLIADLGQRLRELPERLDLFDRFNCLDPSPTSNATTFAIRQYGAWALAEAGRVVEAITVCEDLLSEQVRVLGAEHPDTLLTRQILGGRLGEAGRIEEAITTYEDVLEDRIRVLGPDHPHTLITRHNTAGWIGSAGRVKEAITTYEDVLEDRKRVLGPDHPNTLTTRHNLAYWLGKAGRGKATVSAHEELLADRSRVLGEDHPHTLDTRHNLARWLGEAGRVEEAIAMFESVLADRLRVLGEDHPHTLVTRHNLAHWLGRAGRVEEAIIALEGVLADRNRVLGPENPDTLSSGHVLGGWLGEAGRLGEAIAVFESVATDRLQVLGADDPDGLDTRHNLAQCLGEAGRVEEAIAGFESVLADRLRVLGADDSHTVVTRHALARWLGEAGRGDEPVSANEEVTEDQSSVPATRHGLTGWLGRPSRVD